MADESVLPTTAICPLFRRHSDRNSTPVNNNGRAKYFEAEAILWCSPSSELPHKSVTCGQSHISPRVLQILRRHRTAFLFHVQEPKLGALVGF